MAGQPAGDVIPEGVKRYGGASCRLTEMNNSRTWAVSSSTKGRMVIRALTKTSPVSISGEGQPVPRRTGVEATSEVVPKSVCRAEAGGCRDLFDQHIDSFQQTPRLMNASLDLFAGRCAGSGSQLTRRWREQDSNPRSPVRGAAVLSAVGAGGRRRRSLIRAPTAATSPSTARSPRRRLRR
jgi:hypothetical protein